MRRSVRVIGLVVVLTATGCRASSGRVSSSTTPPAPRTPSVVAAAAVQTSPCTASNATPVDSPRPNDGPRLPSTFVPDSAYICFDQQRTYKGDGIWVVLVGQRLTGDLKPLREALLQPDTTQPPPTPGLAYACAASLVIRPVLIVVSSSGQTLMPRAPVDYCGDQLPALDSAISPLRRATVQVVQLYQIQSQTPSALSPGGPLTRAPATVSLCRYKDTAADPLDAVFVAGRRLTAAQTQRLWKGVTLPGKPSGCSKTHAGILVGGNHASITAQRELGGCARVIRSADGHDSIGRVNASIIDALLPR